MPVSIATAARQDVPIYLTGLGTVQATFTVGIHSQVDGKLQDVLFTEGQHVKKGDVLAKIDPRLFQAALDQAKAKKAQDEAQLIGAAEGSRRASRRSAPRASRPSRTSTSSRPRSTPPRPRSQADEAAIETAQTQLDYTDITAPSDGRMGMRLVDPGNIVHASDTGVDRDPGAGATRPSALFTLPAQTLDDVREAHEARPRRGRCLRPRQPQRAEHRHAARRSTT